MSIARYSVGALSLALLTVGCDAAPRHRVPRVTHHSRFVPHQHALLTRFRLREVGAQALFSSVDPSGCIETFVAFLVSRRR